MTSEGMKKMADTAEQQEQTRYYIAIDLKSFYASVECRDRGLDPLTTNLVVADKSRTSKTICLAVSPSVSAVVHACLRLNRRWQRSMRCAENMRLRAG